MKKLLSLCVFLFGFFSFFGGALASYQTDFPAALDWMYRNSLTRYNDSASFMPERNITREEASRFMTEFAERVMKKQPTNVFNCSFSDSYNFDSTLTDWIYRSCKLGIFRGSQGKFFPKSSLTNAESMTTVLRVVFGMMNETVNPWYTNYFNKATSEGLINDLVMGSWYNANKPALRGDMAVLLYRACKKYSSNCDDYNPNPDQKSCYTTTWGTVQHMKSVVAYRYAIGTQGNSCEMNKELRTCSNGVLDGTFVHSSCVNQNGTSGDLDLALYSIKLDEAYFQPKINDTAVSLVFEIKNVGYSYNASPISSQMKITCRDLSTNIEILSTISSTLPYFPNQSQTIRNATIDVRNILTNTPGYKKITCKLDLYGSIDVNLTNNTKEFSFNVNGNAPSLSCTLPWGATLFDGQTATAYKYDRLTCDMQSQGKNSESSTLKCVSGILQGNTSFSFKDPTIIDSNCGGSQCTLPRGATLANGQSVTAYKYSTLTCNMQFNGYIAESTTLSCVNGSLQGNTSFTYKNPTTVDTCPCQSSSHPSLATLYPNDLTKQNYYTNLGLTIPSSNLIKAYRIYWSDTNLSPWYFPGNNDQIPSTNMRYWSNFKNYNYSTYRGNCSAQDLQHLQFNPGPSDGAGGGSSQSSYGSWNSYGFYNPLSFIPEASALDTCHGDAVNPYSCSMSGTCKDVKRGDCGSTSCEFWWRTVTCY